MWEGDTPPDQVGCDSQRNGTGSQSDGEDAGINYLQTVWANQRPREAGLPLLEIEPSGEKGSVFLKEKQTSSLSLAAPGSVGVAWTAFLPRKGGAPLAPGLTLGAPPPPSAPASGFGICLPRPVGRLQPPNWFSSGSRRSC